MKEGMADMSALRSHLLEGQVIPACPLALDDDGKWNERSQTALWRYYRDSGAGGLAVAVHSTQFEIRRPEIGLFEPLLRLVADLRKQEGPGDRTFALVAGVCGPEPQARREAELAAALGYDSILVSPGGWSGRTEDEFLSHCRELSAVLPLIAFYLQPAVGGRPFGHGFWRRMAELENLVAVKVAPFNRYRTLDVARAVLDSGRRDVALYTGNDDNIVFDLLTGFEAGSRKLYMSGGLLGQWGVWTSQAVILLDQIKKDRAREHVSLRHYEMVNTALTDANAVIFDAAHDFAGCIPGILEVLRRQGLVPSSRCLDPAERLSPGQKEELDRISRMYPFLNDDEFVRNNLERWLK